MALKLPIKIPDTLNPRDLSLNYCLGHHPNIWYKAALFLQESSRLLAEKGVSKIIKNDLT
jgi:hypothetical protein